jgi:carboxyl-terminal processing protease
MSYMKKVLLFILLGIVVFNEGCKKDKAATPTDAIKTPPGSTFDLIRDSVYLYAKEAYYWHDALPDYTTFNPRQYTATLDLDALTKELNVISQYKINPITSKPYEYSPLDPGEAKYSFIDDGKISSELNSVTGDFGFAPFYSTATDLRVKYVYAGSPADIAGIKRGYKITAMNSITSFNSGDATNVQAVIDAFSNSTSITMTLQRPDGTSFNTSLNVAVYTINPIITSKVIDLGNGKKVGYIVFNSFVVLTNVQSKLDAIFSGFATSGITDLIVDLRYDGGGYVETAQYLDGLIAPSTTSGKLMYNTYYNDVLTAGNATLPQVKGYDFTVKGNAAYFGTSHPLNLSRVFFIVTGSTASASELTINSLRPYMNVQLVGKTTYGKPVGFFAININKYQLYTPEFETKNSAGQGGYYTGMVPASTDYPGFIANDDVTKDFGDVTENLLATTLNYINTGAYKTASITTQSLNSTNSIAADQSTLAAKMDRGFKGMILKGKHK